MADTAFKTVYREEFIAGYEERESWLRKTCTTEAEIKGNTAVFLVADSGGASAVTRGSNGLIPARADNNEQLSCTISEWHDLVRKTGFTVDLSQGNQRKIMQMTSMGVLNRKIDSDIFTMLQTATQDTGPTATFNVKMIGRALTILGNNFVPVENEDKMWGVISNAMWAYMMETPEFSRGDYVNVKAYDGTIKRVFRWFGINWIRHPQIPGVGTASEKCFVYHSDSVGHACDKKRVSSQVGNDDEQDYTWCRSSGWFGSKLLQNEGIVVLNHDGSAYTAQ
jgi:hypothetical protein